MLYVLEAPVYRYTCCSSESMAGTIIIGVDVVMSLYVQWCLASVANGSTCTLSSPWQPTPQLCGGVVDELATIVRLVWLEFNSTSIYSGLSGSFLCSLPHVYSSLCFRTISNNMDTPVVAQANVKVKHLVVKLTWKGKHKLWCYMFLLAKILCFSSRSTHYIVVYPCGYDVSPPCANSCSSSP